MLQSVLPFTPDLAKKVSEYCEKHSEVLEIGTFTGFSALAWYEGTKATEAEIVTLDIQSEILKTTSTLFKELGVDDRITLVEGPAATTLPMIDGEFDLIFFDADKENQKLYLNLILEQRLLSPKGVIFVDNVLARGLAVGSGFNPFLEQRWRSFWETAGETMRTVNRDFVEDSRVDTMMLPLFDGVTQIKWKEGFPAERGSSL
ncbi:MAG: hypothetical protein Q9222_000863 [Ikaeria aurantiellina]